MGRESSSRRKEPFNLPSLVFKAKHLGGSAFCNFYRLEVSKQALGGIPPGFGIVVKYKPSELSYMILISSYIMKNHPLTIHVAPYSI